MGLLSTLKKALAVAVTIAPTLPIPDKAKRVIAKVGETEQDVAAIVDEIKPRKPAA